jgi:uncharacterized protein Yka (UPF0111/DUF47 family)
MSFMANLLPKEDKFFVLMRAMSALAHNSALMLGKFTTMEAGAERDVMSGKIAAAKGESKRLMQKVTNEVSISFVTPFDREDIQEFCAHLYKIPKTIDKIRERLELHNMGAIDGDFARQVNLIVQEAVAMEDLVEALTRKGAAKKIVEKVDELHALEASGDEVLSNLLHKLFTDKTDARELILRKDIYDMLEKVLDRYRDAAAIALQIVLKHS